MSLKALLMFPFVCPQWVA